MIDNLLRRRDSSILSANPEAIYVDSTDATYTFDDIVTDSTKTSSSWSNPFKYLQNAINAAAPGNIILVKNGVYHPTHLKGTLMNGTDNVNIVNHTTAATSIRTTAVFTLPSYSINIYAGCIGEEWDESEIMYASTGYPIYATYLDGNITNAIDIVDTTILYGSRLVTDFIASCSIGIVYNKEGNSTSLIKGFIIRYSSDSGVIGSNKNISLSYCKIHDCSAAGGGGACVSSILKNSVIKNCSTAKISSSCTGGGASGSDLTNCIIEYCYSFFYGSAISSCHTNNCIIRYCICQNQASTGSTLYNSSVYDSIIYGCNYTRSCNSNVYNSIFIANYGPINLASTNAYFYNCSFVSTIAINRIPQITYYTNTRLINCLFVGNSGYVTTVYPIANATSTIHDVLNNASEQSAWGMATFNGVEINQANNIANLIALNNIAALPSFIGMPTKNATTDVFSGTISLTDKSIIWDTDLQNELENYVKRIITNGYDCSGTYKGNPINSIANAIINTAGLNTTDYPAYEYDFYGKARSSVGTPCTIGAIEYQS